MEQISKPPISFEVTEATASRPPDYASPAEVEAELKVLVESDFLKLMMIAGVHCRDRNLAASDMEAGELLDQAVLKTLQCEDGKRWNKKVALLRHLDRAMENISGHRLGELIRERKKIAAFSEDPNRDESAQSEPPSKSSGDGMAKVDSLLKSVFGDDKQGREIFELRAQRVSPAEIQSRLGISAQEYETINRRILRKISRVAK